MIGKQILGYTVDEVVGSGSFGTVYKVSKTNASGTYVRALKHIRLPATKQQYNSVLNSMGGDYSKADDYFAAALRETVDEIRILSMLSESGVMNIVRYYENDIIETSHPKTYNIYMMMEFLTPFTDIIESRTMSVGEVIRVGKDILKALISCHEKNIIHRDIKDDNIFVTKDGIYKLGDFGVSKKLQDKSRAASMRGTPNFIAPEVYLGKETYDCTVDLYSLGIVLYRLLNKLRGPFLPAFPNSYTSDDENAAFEARMSGKIPELPLMAQNHLGEVVCKAIMPRQQRYNSAQEFLEALEQAESALSREEWLAPAYEVYVSEDDAEAPEQPSRTSASDGDKTVGGLWFADEEEERIRVGKNLFMTMGADRTDPIRETGTANDSAQNLFGTEYQETQPAVRQSTMPPAQPTGRNTIPPTATTYRDTVPPAQPAGQGTIPPAQPAGRNTGNPNQPVQQNAYTKTQKTGKKPLVIILAACAALVAVLGAVFLFTLITPLEIAGKKFSKSEDYVSLSDVTVTDSDMANMMKLKKLRTLRLINCTVSDDAMDNLRNAPQTLKELEMRNCTGIQTAGAFIPIGALVNLETLVMDGMQLTDADVSYMFQTVPANLGVVDFSNNPALTDISSLSSASALRTLTVSNTAVCDFSDLQGCGELTNITAQNTGMTDASSLFGLSQLSMLYLGDNQIADLEDIENLTSLYNLDLSNNKLSGLDGLEKLASLTVLDISGNEITDLKNLSALTKLEKLYANRNKLTRLEGLEQTISLKVLEVAENQLADINGVRNCTILETVNISSNRISDISLLSKSAGTMKKLYFHYNNVSDISALSGMTNLKYLGFDHNRVGDLDALSGLKSLEVLSASFNEIYGIRGLENANKLQYIYLDHNQIYDMTAIATLSRYSEDGLEVVDLSHNQIHELVLASGKRYSILALYDNPFSNIEEAKKAEGRTLYLSYQDQGDFAGLKDAYTYIVLEGCPLDRQYPMTQKILGVDYLSPYLEFVEADAVDKRMQEAKTKNALGTN